MSLDNLAEQYFETVNSLKVKVQALENEVAKERNLEKKRKLRKKINDLEPVISQNILVYHHLKNYYNKNVKTKY